MKPHDVHSGTYNNFVEDNEEDSKFNVRNHVRMSKYKIGQTKVLWLKKLKILYHKHRGPSWRSICWSDLQKRVAKDV